MNVSKFPIESQLTQKQFGDAYLRLRLNRQTQAILPMSCIQEVLAVPAHRLTPMPNMPECILGLLNHRSRIFWAVDLPRLLGIETLVRETNPYRIAIARVGNAPLGLAVQEIAGAMRLEAEAIAPSPSRQIAASLRPYLQGCVWESTAELLLLDVESILRSPRLHSA